MSSYRTQVLQCFKQLHKTRKAVFQGDSDALNAARQEINREFSKYKHVSNEGSIKELINTANEASSFLMKNVIQCSQIENSANIKVHIRPELLIDDVPYVEMPDDFLQHSKPKKKCEVDTHENPS